MYWRGRCDYCPREWLAYNPDPPVECVEECTGTIYWNLIEEADYNKQSRQWYRIVDATRKYLDDDQTDPPGFFVE